MAVTIHLITYQQLHDKGPCFSKLYCGNFYICKHYHHIRSSRCSNEFTNSLWLLKIILVYNWSFIEAPKGSEIHKKWPIVWPPPLPYLPKWTVKRLLKNSRNCKHVTNFKTPPPPPFYVDVLNVCSLCYGKSITQMKDDPSFIKFLKPV